MIGNHFYITRVKFCLATKGSEMRMPKKIFLLSHHKCHQWPEKVENMRCWKLNSLIFYLFLKMEWEIEYCWVRAFTISELFAKILGNYLFLIDVELFFTVINFTFSLVVLSLCIVQYKIFFFTVYVRNF